MLTIGVLGYKKKKRRPQYFSRVTRFEYAIRVAKKSKIAGLLEKLGVSSNLISFVKILDN